MLNHGPRRQLTFHDGSCCKCGAMHELIRISEFGKALCPACYPEFFRRRIAATIRRFRMIPKRAHAAVAVSGGNDSGALLDALARSRGRRNFLLTAIHVDMGLGEYSADCLAVCEAQARAARVPLEVESVADHGIEIEAVGQWPVCAVCGGLRRALLPRIARRVKADVVCIGHTLDDQLQFMLKNIISGNPVSPPPLLRGTAARPGRAKPLIQIPDAATKVYVELLGIPVVEGVCPRFVPESHRFKEVFELLEQHAPMSKLQVWRTLRTVMEAEDEGEERQCEVCGEPTRMRICPICRLRAAQSNEGATK